MKVPGKTALITATKHSFFNVKDGSKNKWCMFFPGGLEHKHFEVEIDESFGGSSKFNYNKNTNDYVQDYIFAKVEGAGGAI